MKKIFLILFAVVILVPFLSAQDIIILRNGDDIQAVVQDIDDVDITYKMFENPDGPDYVLKKSTVFMIRYANGSKEVFLDVTVPSREHESFIVLKSNDSEMAAFLKENDAVLYNQFQKGIWHQKKGKQCIKTGLIVTGAGGVLFLVGLGLYSWNDDALSLFTTYFGLTAAIVGPCIVLTSVPFYAAGGSLKRRAVESYESKHYLHRTSYQPSLDFNVSGNGVGLTFRF